MNTRKNPEKQVLKFYFLAKFPCFVHCSIFELKKFILFKKISIFDLCPNQLFILAVISAFS